MTHLVDQMNARHAVSVHIRGELMIPGESCPTITEVGPLEANYTPGELGSKDAPY